MAYVPIPYTRKDAKVDLMTKTHQRENLCEKIRTVYDLIHELPESEFKTTITERLTDIFLMAKKLAWRLAYFVNTYEDESGNKGINIPKTPDVNRRARMRRVRKVE